MVTESGHFNEVKKEYAVNYIATAHVCGVRVDMDAVAEAIWSLRYANQPIWGGRLRISEQNPVRGPIAQKGMKLGQRMKQLRGR